jgi:DICT domain-containing protein/GAF domain-containing protein
MKDSNSLLQDLLQSLPKVKAQIYFKAALTAISHAMEDLVLAGTDQPLVIANFQQERFYRQEAGRYQRIAQCTDQIYVLAAPETDFASAPAPYATIGLEPTDGLAQEWHLVIVGKRYSACLVCREYAAPVDTVALDSARQFRGFWTFDPDVSRQAALLLLQRIKPYRPDLAGQIRQAYQRYQLADLPERGRSNPSTLDLDARLFIDRLVTYLQASQYKQVKAYRRIVVQERHERLINGVAAAIRQSLKPEDILSVTIREVSQLFGQCRGLLYRLPLESMSLVQATSFIEYESANSSLPSLLGKHWLLATHPLFQPILNQGNSVAIADTSQDLGIQAQPDLQKQLEQAQIQACLIVPICYQQQCLAVLELHQPQPYLWSTAERELLTAIATQAGVALIQAEAFTNLKQLNRQLVALKQTQNNLIAIVGHELRTPLSTIQVCLESLEAEPDMPLAFQQSMVETALADSERLRKLIQDFLLLSRLESDLSVLQVEPINLADSITLAISHLQVTAQPRPLPTISVDIRPTLPLAIADGEALFQLLSKLLDNACKFTPPTGTITLKVKDVNLSVDREQTRPQPMLEVQIADTGRGIEPNQLETIFERFHQEEGFLQRAVGGAGLGLAICRQLARQLGGQIWATSKGKGQGSQFYFTLPLLVNEGFSLYTD